MNTTLDSLSETYIPDFGRYGNGRLYIGFETSEGDYWSDLTVNLPHVELEDGEVVIDANSQDPNLIEAAWNAYWFTYTGRTVSSGFVTYRVARLNKDLYRHAVVEADK